MALINIFKKEKKEEEKEEKKEVSQKKEKEEAAKQETSKPPVKRLGLATSILVKPHISEKASNLTSSNKYIFEVAKKANKPEIKKAVESLYGVNVLSVNIINIPSKRRRLGRISGWRKGYKKAIVEIKEGQKIEIMPR